MKYNLDSYIEDNIENNERNTQRNKTYSKNIKNDDSNREVEFSSKCENVSSCYDDEIYLFRTETTCIGLDKTFRNEKSLRIDISDEIDMSKNQFSYEFKEPGDCLGNNNIESTITSSFEEILTKNSKNFHKYKTEGCLVIYDEIQTKTPYTIDFAFICSVCTFFVLCLWPWWWREW